jgi:glycosyltransferase involved in cell wall biosynthesis
MIVKDEAKVIERCLSSVKGLVDYWVIVDTGSSDGTQEIIKKFMSNVPGELHERPWVNFSHNRFEALKLAKNKGDYLLFIDADEVLVLKDHFEKPALDKDSYVIPVLLNESEGVYINRGFLIDNHLDWRWEGVLHEQLKCTKEHNIEFIKTAEIHATAQDGARARDPNKYMKDAELLEKGLVSEPDNSRYVFYLAQSYLNAGKPDLALKNYQRRSEMVGGWEEEVYISKYMIGLIQELSGLSSETFVDSYCKAYLSRPSRVEPLYKLANYFFRTQNFILGYVVAKQGLNIPVPDDILYVEKPLYEHGLLFEFANCAYELGRFTEAKESYERLLKVPSLPQDTKRRVQKNLILTDWKLNFK